MSATRILFVINSPDFFLSHRLPLAIEARKAGFDVHIATAAGETVKTITTKGFNHHVIPISRGGQNPFNELRTIFALIRLFRKLKPDLVHLVTIKPVIYGGIAARLTGVKAVVSAVSGLGTVFLGNSLLAKVRRLLVIRLYRFAFRHKNLRIIFQNKDDCEVLLRYKAFYPHQSELIKGSGVDLRDYPYSPEPEGIPVVVMASRLLLDKGVREFVSAANILKKNGTKAEFRLIGAPDPGNPSSVPPSMIEKWEQEGIVRLLGYRKDIARQYAQANIVCLPSYREGLPKSLLEAAACGRAIVTTDVPGCRDAIIPNITGVLVPPKNPQALASAIKRLIDNPGARQKMGKEGRSLAEREFAIEKIVNLHTRIYQKLLNK